MLARLDQETRDQHAEVDVYWLDLMASGVTREQYRSLLVRLYGFEAPLESALAYTPHLVVADRRERTLSGLLAQDLLALGLSPSKIARLPQCSLAPFRDPAEALGWMYVVERATLLHDAVRRYLEGRLPATAAFGYLSAYEGVAGSRWHELGRVIDEVARLPTAPEHILSATRRAFACQREWFASVASA